VTAPARSPRTATGRFMVEEAAEDNPEFQDWLIESVLAIEDQSLPTVEQLVRAWHRAFHSYRDEPCEYDQQWAERILAALEAGR